MVPRRGCACHWADAHRWFRAVAAIDRSADSPAVARAERHVDLLGGRASECCGCLSSWSRCAVLKSYCWSVPGTPSWLGIRNDQSLGSSPQSERQDSNLRRECCLCLFSEHIYW